MSEAKAKKAAKPKQSKTKGAAKAAVMNPGSLAGIGSAITGIGVAFGGDVQQWAAIGGGVSMLATLAASFYGARGERSGS